jgi:CobQ-like glutamine amidotransferase family enzyme
MSQKKSITILQLYPREMNIYGDHGNLLVLQRRLEWYGYQAIIKTHEIGDTLIKDADMIVGGGGQDSGQDKIYDDLLAIGPGLKAYADSGTPMLMVCGLYQLFGNFFKTSKEKTLNGIGVLDIETHGTNERLIGNIVTTTKEFGDIVGYENHSGQTTLGRNVSPLGTVTKGAGNNSQDGHEGARYNNVIGSYLHGSILPKNPRLADFFIRIAVTNKYGEFAPEPIDDTIAETARSIAVTRPR